MSQDNFLDELATALSGATMAPTAAVLSLDGTADAADVNAVLRSVARWDFELQGRTLLAAGTVGNRLIGTYVLARFLALDGARALTGQLVSDAELTCALTESQAADYIGVQTALTDIDGAKCLRHDGTALAAVLPDEPLAHAYALRTLQRLRSKLFARLLPMKGTTLQAVPPLNEWVHEVIATIPAIQHADHREQLNIQTGSVSVLVEAQLYGEISFRLVVVT